MSTNFPGRRGRGAYSKEQGRLNTGQQGQGHRVSWEVQDGSANASNALFKQLQEEEPGNNLSRCVKYYYNLEKDLKQWYLMAEDRKLAEKTFNIWERIFEYIVKIMKVSDTIFSLSTDYYLRKEIDSRLWKYGIYQYIKILRGAPTAIQSWRDEALKSLLDTGLKHFENMLKVSVPNILSVELEPVFARSAFLRESVSQESTRDFIYRIFIIMGDLYRYRHASFADRRDEKMALSMYTGARFCDPNKTRAYHQLGLITRFQGDIVGMIYLFIRASQTNAPTEGAGSQLKMIFGEINECYTKRKATFWFTSVKQADKELSKERQTRCDIWIPSTDSKAIHEVFPLPPLPVSRHDHINSLATEEVYSRFSLAYGHFIGILYTNIGTENLEHVGKELLVYFEGLVMFKRYHKFDFYMEVIGILIFMIDHLKPSRNNNNHPSKAMHMNYLRDKALDLTLVILTILIEKLLDLVMDMNWDNPMLPSCCAVLLVWCNWAQRRKSLKGKLLSYIVKSSPSKTPAGFFVCLIRLHNVLKHFDGTRRYGTFPTLKSQPDNICTEALKVLPENVILDGFCNVVVESDKGILCFYDSVFSKEKAELQYRVSEIDQFLSSFVYDLDVNVFKGHVDVYEPIESIYQQEFKILNTIYQKKKPDIFENQKQHRRPDCNNARVIIRPQRNQEKFEEYAFEEGLPMVTKSLNNVNEINAQLALMGVKTEMLIKPVRVVLDTNTLIRQLDWIKYLMYVLPNRLIIPTTVLLELRGLAKGAKTGLSARRSSKSLSPAEQKVRMENVMITGGDCERALDFLDEHKRYFKLVSILGKEIKMYKFKSQKVFDKRLHETIRNDEKILETCNQLELQDEKLRALDHPLRIHRGTVLLTNDKSLRVRAYAHDMPSHGIQAFATWVMKYRARGK